MHLGHHYFWWHWRDAGLEGLIMNREDIVRMAKEVGMESFDICVELDDFAKLVAQHEREACAKVCDAFQARDVGMQPAECAGAIRARGQA
jgi:hypothetical protein